ncbi:MAG: hypothetical protein J6Y52_01505 [Bacteroidales bacterium]|nr:hypothetical protein [Bacteroidales bacterium]
MKKVLAFVSCAMFVAAMTVACGHKNAEAVDSTVEETVEEVATEAAPVEAAVDADAAMLAAAKEAGQAVCNCTNGDATSIEKCMKSVLAAGYAEYQGNDAFTAAVRAEIDNCIKAKATAAAKDAANEGIKEGAKALSNALNKKN